MIIFEGTISHKVFKDLIGERTHHHYEEIILGLAKGAAITMFVYYFFQALLFIHEERWTLITDFWGYWYLLEVIGFVLIPCFMFAYAVRNRKLGLIKVASVMALLGIILNRLNVSVIAFSWYAVDHILSILAGNCSNAHGSFHRNMGLQMDSYPHAGFQQRIETEAHMEFYYYVNIFETKGLGISFVTVVPRFVHSAGQVPLRSWKEELGFLARRPRQPPAEKPVVVEAAHRKLRTTRRLNDASYPGSISAHFILASAQSDAPS